MTEDIGRGMLPEGELDAVTGGGDHAYWYYKVVRGDTIEKIAQRFHTTVPVIRTLNPIISDPVMLRIGWVLKIPAR